MAESGEGRFERWRSTVGLFLGPAAGLALFLAPLPRLTPQAHFLAAVLVWVVLWWVTEPIPLPLTGLLGAVLCIIGQVAPARDVLAPFADPVIFLFMGSFLIAEAMMIHGLDRRFAFGILALPWIGNRAGRILFAYGMICAGLSLWISNTATTAMMFPIGLGIIHSLASLIAKQTGSAVDPKKLRFATGMMLMASYASSAGGIGTPVGTPPNLIGLAMIEKFTGVKIPFFQWLWFCLPLLTIMYIALFLILSRLHKPEVVRIEGCADLIREERSKIGPWTRGQKNALAAFLTAIVLWTTPGALAILFGVQGRSTKLFSARMPEAAAALVAATLLFVLPVNWKAREFTLTWKQALRIDWGTLLLFGGGLSLGGMMFKTGLAEAVGRGLVNAFGATSVWGLTLAAVFIGVLVSEATSNTASANIVIPVMISLSLAAGINPLPPAIGATLGASWGFMLPISTPPNAIVYGSGLVPITKMIRAGFIFDIIGGIVIWLGLRIMLPLVGLA
jgi:sodium-dependent dicarboxylate transporter 2/3/5